MRTDREDGWDLGEVLALVAEEAGDGEPVVRATLPDGRTVTAFVEWAAP